MSTEAIDKRAGREDKDAMTEPLATHGLFAAPAEWGPKSVKTVLREVLGGGSSSASGQRRVVDIGCGNGALVRSLQRQDMDAIGVDVDARMLQAALSGARPAPPGRWIAGTAERLPIASCSVDIVIFLNSLHHIRPDRQVAALAEGARLLRHGGDLIVIEPAAAGSFFELLAPLDDETVVRAAAQLAVQAVAGRLLLPVAAACFTTTVTFADPATVLASFTDAAPARVAAAQAVAATITRRFHALGDITADGARSFGQPMKLHHLRKA